MKSVQKCTKQLTNCLQVFEKTMIGPKEGDTNNLIRKVKINTLFTSRGEGEGGFISTDEGIISIASSYSRDEHAMVDARKEFYARAEADGDSESEKALAWGKFVGKNRIFHLIK